MENLFETYLNFPIFNENKFSNLLFGVYVFESFLLDKIDTWVEKLIHFKTNSYRTFHRIGYSGVFADKRSWAIPTEQII